MNDKKLLLISKLADAKPFVGYLAERNIDTIIEEDFETAFRVAQKWGPKVITFLVPVYWESIVDFVEKVKSDITLMDTKILYIGKLIEGADMDVLQQYGVKTMALGPVPTQEIVRYIDDMFRQI